MRTRWMVRGPLLAACVAAGCSSSGDRSVGQASPVAVAAQNARFHTTLARFPSFARRVASARLIDVSSASPPPLKATLPSSAGGALRLEPARRTDSWIEVTALDVADIPARAEGGTVLFMEAARSLDVLVLQDSIGVEELRILHDGFASTTARYAIRVGPGIVAVRARAHRIEAVDATGYVRVGTGVMYAVDARGVRRDLDVVVERRGETWLVTTTFDAHQLELPVAIDPAWTTVASMSHDRYYYGTARLNSGKVLVVGGNSSTTSTFDPRPSAEVYDETKNTWTDVASLHDPRTLPTAVTLGSGKVLVFAGGNPSGALSVAEVYDPVANTWTRVSSMKTEHEGASATLLPSGKVLAVGGENNSTGGLTCGSTAELYDATTDTWSVTPPMSTPRCWVPATLLPSGKVLVAGGSTTAPTSADLYDSATNTWTKVANMTTGHVEGFAVLLPTGKVLVGGGDDVSTTTSVVELYDPSLDKWTPTGSTIDRYLYPAFALLGGVVIVSGGSISTRTTTNLYDPSSGAWRSGPNLSKPHDSAGAGIILPSGKFMVAGGIDSSSSSTSSVEVYDSAPSCSADSSCAATEYCAGTCAPKLTPGSSCSRAAMCASGNCVDGLCCDKACAGDCEACSASAKGSGLDGVCGNVAADTDPRSRCPVDPGFPSSCKADGQCDGAGKCRAFAKSGTACGATSCASGTVTGTTCDGAGTCTPSSRTSCAPYACDASGLTCRSSCASPSDCVGTATCIGSACVAKAANGAACGAGSACTSGNCVDGICCDTSCVGACRACTAAKKGAGVDGACGAAKSGTSCGASTCTAGSVAGMTCNAAGTCASSTGTPCAPYVCDPAGKSCLTSCGSSGDCVAGDTCSGGACIATPPTVKANGEVCTSSAECVSGQCVDGVCCNVPCDGQCQACDLKGSVGTCSAVAGPPHGARTSCGDPATSCAGKCDGVGTQKCVYPAAGGDCGNACTSGEATKSVCNGSGTCVAGAPTSCNGFVCDGQSCASHCDDDKGCVGGYYCDNGTCARIPPETVPIKTGCGCTIPTTDGELGGWAAFVGALAMMGTRRRRRANLSISHRR